MLIPLGFWAASAGGGAASSFDLLETQVLSSSAASVTFSGLSTYAADYQHLQIRLTARSTRAANGDYLKFQFNGDTASNYRIHVLRGTSSSVTSATFGQTTFLEFIRVPAASDTASAFGAGVVDLLDAFDSNKNTVARALGGGNPFAEVGLSSGLYLSTSALSSVTIGAANGNLAQFSRFSLYGIKAGA